MMGYGYGVNWGVFGLLGFIFWIVIFIDAILLMIWLWRQVQKK